MDQTRWRPSNRNPSSAPHSKRLTFTTKLTWLQPVLRIKIQCSDTKKFKIIVIQMPKKLEMHRTLPIWKSRRDQVSRQSHSWHHSDSRKEKMATYRLLTHDRISQSRPQVLSWSCLQSSKTRQINIFTTHSWLNSLPQQHSLRVHKVNRVKTGDILDRSWRHQPASHRAIASRKPNFQVFVLLIRIKYSHQRL